MKRDSWKDSIRRDLQAFADPGTTVDFSEARDAMRVRWESRGRVYDAEVTRHGGVTKIALDGHVMTYETFLASSANGDLTALAKMILQSQEKDGIFIDTKAIQAAVYSENAAN